MGKACHNCRRRRLRCDFSVPTCFKCVQNDQQCLGYGPLIRWLDKNSKSTPQPPTNEPQSNAYVTADVKRKTSPKSVVHMPTPQLSPTLVDPFFKDLDSRSRQYLAYCILLQPLQKYAGICTNNLQFRTASAQTWSLTIS